MPSRDVQVLTVLGAGDMGHGIAELAALKGIQVRLRDVNPASLDRARERVTASLAKLAEKGQVTSEEAAAAGARITYTLDLQEALKGTEAVIEAVPELLGLKQKVFSEVEELAPPEALLASNTSGIRIGEIGAVLHNPSRLVGLHFFNPVMLMDLVEVVPSEFTTPEYREAGVALSRKLGKRVVVCEKDLPGFITTRLMGAFFNSAAWLSQKGRATPEEVDSALRFRAGFPMGPFELADMVGLDVARDAGHYIAERLGPAYRTAPLIEERAAGGNFGKKTGRGFYDWSSGKPRLSPEAGKAFDPALVLAVVANEAAKLVEEGAGSPAEVDEAMRLGCGFPKGPLEWADETGLDRVLMALLDLREKLSLDIHEPADLLVNLVKAGKIGRRAGQGFYAHAKAPAQAPGPVLLSVDAPTGVATLVINRPHRLNALTGEVLEALKAAVEALGHDPSVRAILLRGAGEKAFCAGADLGDQAQMSPVDALALARRGQSLTNAIEKCGKPVVAALNGYALGGGFELALACDFRLAAARAEVGLPEVALGLIPAMGGTQRLPKLVGLAKAKEFILLGGRVKADEALRLGIVTAVYPNDQFDAEVRAFAERLARGAPVAQSLAKQALHVAMTADTAVGQEFEAAAFGMVLSTEDAAEGVRAFLTRERAAFQGK